MRGRALLERQAELAALEVAFSHACSGKGSLVLVSGEAGIGKTSLVETFTLAHDKGALILRGYCDALLTPSPLEPLRDIAPLLDPALAKALDAPSQTSALFGRVLERLRSVHRPCVLVIEDIHWADQGTLDLVRYLGRRLDTARVLLIATYRDDEVRRYQPLQRMLGELASAAAIERISLTRFSPAAVAQLAGDHGTSAELLYKKTSGNPFFVSEALAYKGTGLPGSVRDAVLARAASLTQSGRALLDLAAVIGIRCDYAHLEAVLGDDTSGLSECLAAGLLEDTGTGIAFRHMLARDAIIEAIEPLRRRSLYRQVLTGAIGAGYIEQGQMARLAHYAEGASAGPEVIRFGLLAAKVASAAGSHREAAAHYRSVLRFLQAAPGVERARVLTFLAGECAIVDELPEATEAYRAAVMLWTSEGDRRQQGSTLAALAWPLVRDGQNAAAEAAIREAIGLLEPLGSTSELAAAYRTQAHLRMLDRDRGNAVSIGGKAIKMAGQLGDIGTLAAAELVVGAAKLVSDDPAGRSHLERCISLARDAGLEETVALAYMNIGTSYGEQYRFAAAEAQLAEALAYTQAHDLDHTGHYISAWLALIDMHQGRFENAARTASEVLNRQQNVSTIARIMALVALGRVCIRRADGDAASVLDDALALARQTGTLQRLAPVHAARAELAFAGGDQKTAIREASAVLELAVARQHAWHTGEFLYWLQRCGVQSVPPHFVAEPYALQLSGRWAEAANAWRDRNCPFEQARALADGDQPAQVRALAIFDTLGAVPAAATLRRQLRAAGAAHVPRGPRISTRSNDFGLTQRELVTLTHLSRGLSNVAIAKAMFISPKTVDHHVSAILAKLNTGSRGEAAERATTAGLIGQNGETSAAK